MIYDLGREHFTILIKGLTLALGLTTNFEWSRLSSHFQLAACRNLN
jgi:hypothetical protein